MTDTGVRSLAATALLGGALILAGCTAPTLTPPVASGTAPSSSISEPSGAPSTPVATETVAPSAQPSGPSASASVSGSASPETDLRGTTMGLLRGYDVGTGVVSVDVVYFLSGDQAITYLAERPSLWQQLECPSGPYAGGSTAGCSVPNDYYLVNENPRVRTLPLAPQARIRLIPWPNCCEATPATRDALAARAASQPPLLMSFDVTESGQISELSEFYTP